jgi:hypothetical protein
VYVFCLQTLLLPLPEQEQFGVLPQLALEPEATVYQFALGFSVLV